MGAALEGRGQRVGGQRGRKKSGSRKRLAGTDLRGRSCESFTAAVKLIVNDSRRSGKIESGDGRPIGFPRTSCSPAKKTPVNRIGPPATSFLQLHHADFRYFSPALRDRSLVVTS
jgi:hypothetical protein